MSVCGDAWCSGTGEEYRLHQSLLPRWRCEGPTSPHGQPNGKAIMQPAYERGKGREGDRGGGGRGSEGEEREGVKERRKEWEGEERERERWMEPLKILVWVSSVIPLSCQLNAEQYLFPLFVIGDLWSFCMYFLIHTQHHWICMKHSDYHHTKQLPIQVKLFTHLKNSNKNIPTIWFSPKWHPISNFL